LEKKSKDFSSLLCAKAQIASHQKKNEEAEKLFKEAIEVVEGTANQAAPTKTYAIWLKSVGRKEEAKAKMTEAKKLNEQFKK